MTTSYLFGLFHLNPQQFNSLDWYWSFGPTNTSLYDSPFNFWFPAISIALYLAMLVVLPKIVTKPATWTEKILPTWNFCLWILSVIMFLGGAEATLRAWLRFGNIHDMLCHIDIVTKPDPLIFWTYIFLLSKFLELGDTVFVVLRHPEKPVELLHWWHHISVLAFSWYAGNQHMGCGLLFFVMNALVHSFMYYYYWQMSIGNRPKWAKWLTIGQILQMIIGSSSNVYWMYLYYTNQPCSALLMMSAGIMYASYLYLFLDFFIRKYILNSTKKDTPSDEKKQK